MLQGLGFSLFIFYLLFYFLWILFPWDNVCTRVNSWSFCSVAYQQTKTPIFPLVLISSTSPQAELICPPIHWTHGELERKVKWNTVLHSLGRDSGWLAVVRCKLCIQLERPLHALQTQQCKWASVPWSSFLQKAPKCHRSVPLYILVNFTYGAHT